MARNREEDIATHDEAVRIGNATRTSRMWKRNGNLKTVGKNLKEMDPNERQLKHLVRKVRAVGR
jgi:hypothetical protein